MGAGRDAIGPFFFFILQVHNYLHPINTTPMATSLQRKIDILKNVAIAQKVHLTEGFEDYVPHMYLDVSGQVTVGIGHGILGAPAACTLPFKHGDGKAATQDEITKEYQAIHAHRNAQREKAKTAKHFQGMTSLVLGEADIYKLAQLDIEVHERILRPKFPEYDKYPAGVQEVLLDMVFSMGINKLMTGYPKFVTAVRKKDWKTAAENCGRRQVQRSRNLAVETRLRNAAAPAGGDLAAVRR